MLYRILLFSVKPQHESAIDVHISPPFCNSLPSPSPSHPSRLIQNPCLSFLSHTANSHWLSILHLVVYMLPCYFLHLSHPLLLLFCRVHESFTSASPLEKAMAPHSSTLAWRIPGMGEPGGLLSLGSHRVGHD